MSALSSLRQHLTWIDLVLGAAAVVGLLLYIFGLPRVHPDATASYALGADEVEERADMFLADQGWEVAGGHWQTEFRRRDNLLEALQTQVGRSEAIRLLKEQPDGLLPGYAWRARYIQNAALSDLEQGFQAGSSSDEDDVANDLSRVTLWLTMDGAVWDAEYQMADEDERDAERPFLDRSALRAVFPEAEPDATLGQPPEGEGDQEQESDAQPTEEQQGLSGLSDSLLVEALRFSEVDTTWRSDAPPRLSEDDLMDRVRTATDVQEEGRQREIRTSGNSLVVIDRSGILLPPGSAVALARYHLNQSAWTAEAFTVDSVQVVQGRGGQNARVQFARTSSPYQHRMKVDVEVTAGGALQRLEAQLEPQDEPSQTIQTVAGVTEVVILGLLTLILVVIFFKRLGARLIDNVVIRVDGILIGILMALTVGLTADLDLGPESFWIQLGLKVLVAGFTGGMTGLLVGILAGAGDSITRAEWSKKVYTASLIRLSMVRNVFVGAALLRGVSLAFVLVGLHVLLLMLLPEAALRLTQQQFAYHQTLQPSIWITAQEGVGAYYTALVVLLGAGTFIRRTTARPAVVLAVIVATFTLALGGIMELMPAGYAWLAGAMVGLVLGGSYLAFDFVTCFVAYFGARVLWLISEGWLVSESPMVLDVVVIALLFGTVLVLGFIGVASGRTRREVGDYVPEYVEELTRQERLKRELEIAQQVQSSFLPRRMPDVEGVDVAAMCLAAQEVGGDYYDFIEVEPGRLAVVVGDVSGKGIQAAFYMTLAKGMLQALCRRGASPAEVMRELNALFYGNVPRGTFISMIYGVLDVEARTFTFARAGHNPVILKRSPSQHSDFVQPAGMALGLVDGTRFNETIEETHLDLRMGDVLVFYTDGFSEAMNLDKDQYGDERLAAKVSSLGQKSASAILHAVAEDVHHFVEGMGRHDDMTMVVLKLSRRAGFSA